MKYLLGIFLLFSWTAMADESSSATLLAQQILSDSSKADEYFDQAMQKWAPFALQHGSSPDIPVFISDAQSEPDFMKEYPSLISQFPKIKDIGWLSQAFESSAWNAFHACKIDKLLQEKYPSAWDSFNKNYYTVRIISVPFNLCPDANSSACSFEDSFAAKNFPSLKLILVNAYKWNTMKQDERMALAVHEFLGVFGVEESTYGLSSNVDIGTVTKTTPSGYQQWMFCIHGN